MFGPFPMATLEEHGDLNLSLDASDSPEHKYTTNVDTPHRAELSAVNLSFSGSESPATTPTDTTSSHAGSEPPKFVLQPGNAFSLKAFRESEESKLPRRRPGSLITSSSVEEHHRPRMPRKSSSGLDYNEELALPMPKPRHIRPDPPETPDLPEEEDMKSSTFKRRAVTDPAFAGSSHSEPTTPEDSKKKSRLELIKSKLSFKDLRKESLKSEISSPIPAVPDVPTLSSSENTKVRPRRPLAGSGIPAISPSTYNFRAKLRPAGQNKPSTVGVPTASGSQVDVAPSRIPLPPSGTFSNAQGTMAPVRSTSRRLVGSVNPGPAPVETKSSKERPAAQSKTLTPTSTGKSGPDIVVTRPSLETSFKKRRPSTPPVPSIDYPDIGDSPPNANDLLEGTGKVKYLPRHWVVEEESTPSPAPKPKLPVPSAYKKGEAPVESLPDYISPFKERLQKANIPLDRPVPQEIQNRSTAAHVDDIVDMVQSIQRQAETGIQNLNKKLDELSSWIGHQLKNEVDSISELARTNSDLFAKQFEISKEMMKFQLDVRTEIGVMERRLNIFEIKVIDELQAELRTLTRSQDVLNSNTEELHAKLLSKSGDTQKYMEEMRQKNEEIEQDIEDLKTKGVHPEILALEGKLAMIQRLFGNQDVQKRAEIDSEAVDVNSHLLTPDSLKTISPVERQERRSTPRGTETVIRSPLVLAEQAEATQSMPAPSAHSSPAQPRVTDVPPSKPTSMFPRSVSLSKKGFLKNMKDAVSTTQEQKDKEKEKALEKTTPSDDPKKWNVFGFRRRRQLSDSAGSGSSKFSWPTSRRAKDTSAANDTTSSRSSTPPVPPIPRMIPHVGDKTSALGSSRPPFRGTAMQSKPHEGETLAAQKMPTASASVQSHFHHEDGSARGSVQNSTCTPASSFGENKHAGSSVISPGSFHSAQDEHASDLPAYSAVDDIARAPLLGDADPDWDRVSLRESQSRETLI